MSARPEEKPPAEPKMMHDLHDRADRVRRIGRFTSMLTDPEAPGIGAIFNEACKKADVREIIDPFETINAAFRSFIMPPNPGEKGLRNKLVYGDPAFESGGRLFAARTHESIHAMQYAKAAAMHADPFNPAAPFFLTPEDYVRRKELLEADAYAKGAWLQSLAGAYSPETKGALDLTPLPASVFEEVRKTAATLQETLEKAAELAGSMQGHWIKDMAASTQEQDVWLVTPARDLWHKLALEEYKAIVEWRKKGGETSFTLVTMSEDDARAIGDSFGPNLFEKAAPPLRLSDSNRQLLDDLNAMLKDDIAKAKPLADALAERSLTPESFISASYAYRAPSQQKKQGTSPAPGTGM